MVIRAAAWSVVTAAVFAVAGCGEGRGTMRPGENCLQCHGGGEKSFSAAGTVYRADGSAGAGLTVTLVDSASTETSFVTNSAGNFYFDEPLVPPFQASITDGTTTVSMQGAAGACNSCHQAGGAAQAHIVFP